MVIVDAPKCNDELWDYLKTSLETMRSPSRVAATVALSILRSDQSKMYHFCIRRGIPVIIDAHNHPNYHGHDARKILENMDAQDIDQMWLLSWETPRDEYDVELFQRVLPPTAASGIPLEDVLAVGREAPDRFVIGYAPHPKRPDAIDRFKSAVETHGVRLAGESKARIVFDDPDYLKLLHVFGEYRTPVTIHLEYDVPHGRGSYPRPDYWYGGTIEALERALIACPNTMFIGHGPGWWSHISGDDKFDKQMYPEGPILPGGKNQRLLREYPNMYADLSAISGLTALSRNDTFARGYLIDFQDKLLFARDWFKSSLMDHLVKLDLPKAAFDKITYLNAQRLLTGQS